MECVCSSITFSFIFILNFENWTTSLPRGAVIKNKTKIGENLQLGLPPLLKLKIGVFYFKIFFILDKLWSPSEANSRKPNTCVHHHPQISWLGFFLVDLKNGLLKIRYLFFITDSKHSNHLEMMILKDNYSLANSQDNYF